MLFQEIGPYSQNSYFLHNTNALGSITVTLETAPVDNDDYYVPAAATSVDAGDHYLTAVTALMRYARLRVQTGSSAIGVSAYYNGRA